MLTYAQLLTLRVAVGHTRHRYLENWRLDSTPYWAQEIQELNDADLVLMKAMSTDRPWIEEEEVA